MADPQPPPQLTATTTELLQAMIRNACVNDGSTGSGEESRNAEIVDDVLHDLPRMHYEPVAGRRSVLTTIEGSDPSAPTVLLCGHTDVVPVSADQWRHDPFGGELIDGEVWGRGAVDMLGLTAAMTATIRHLADRREPPRSTIRFLAVADEEAGGTHGAGWVTEHAWDDVACDYVLTESGGMSLQTPQGPRIVLSTAEKGLGWRRLTVRGTPGHGSRPYGADNALVTAAEVVRRLDAHRPRARLSEHWRQWVSALPVDAALRARLLDPDRLETAIGELDPRTARYCHALSHVTMSPNVIHGGTKINVVPDAVTLDVDIRTLPEVSDEEVDRLLLEVLDDLADRVEIAPAVQPRPATASPTDTPMFDLLRRRAQAVHPGAAVLPWMSVGGTDAAFFRARGVPSYGAAMFSPDVSLQAFQARFHGHDERIDTRSLGLTAGLYLDIADGIADAAG